MSETPATPALNTATSPLAKLAALWRRLPAWSGAAFAFAILVLAIVTYEYFKLGQMNFIKPMNMLNVLKANSEVGILAVGMTLIIILGGIDLGVGSLLAIAGALGILALNAAAGGDNSARSPSRSPSRCSSARRGDSSTASSSRGGRSRRSSPRSARSSPTGRSRAGSPRAGRCARRTSGTPRLARA